jgi:hypothetical protein
MVWKDSRTDAFGMIIGTAVAVIGVIALLLVDHGLGMS